MNYAAHYEKLIARARSRTLTGYKERHHVLPRCMGGDDSPQNLVELTAEEHYVAHQLLCKMRPTVKFLAVAAMRMAKQCTGNKGYGWLRRRHAEAMRGNQRTKGFKHSPESRAKMSAAQRGKKNALGCVRSPETLAKMSAASRGRQTFLGRKHSAGTRAKISAAHRGNQHCLGRTLSTETRAKISASLTAMFSARRSNIENRI